MDKNSNPETIIPDFIVSVTGHRFWKDRDYERMNLYRGTDKLVRTLEKTYSKPMQTVLIHGCATGVDLWFGEIAIELGLPLELYLPFPRIMQMVKGNMGPHQRYSLDKQIEYAEKIVICSQNFYSYGYQKRNIALVKRCDLLASYFIRKRSGSGNAVRTAEKMKKPVVDLRTIMEIADFEDSIHDIQKLM